MTNTTERCETCRFAKAYPMPEGECPPLPEPEKPKGFWANLFGDGPYPFFVSEMFWKSMPHISWKSAERRAQTQVKCERFPDSMDKLKTDWCGEYHA